MREGLCLFGVCMWGFVFVLGVYVGVCVCLGCVCRSLCLFGVCMWEFVIVWGVYVSVCVCMGCVCRCLYLSGVCVGGGRSYVPVYGGRVCVYVCVAMTVGVLVCTEPIKYTVESLVSHISG